MAPLYDFRCQNARCGTVTEVLVKIGHVPEKERCPKCNAPALRMLTLPNIEPDGRHSYGGAYTLK